MVQSLAAHAKAKVMSTVLHANCDAAAACVTRREAPVAHPNLVLATTILASSLAFIDGSVVNVGLPAIGRSLSADTGRAAVGQRQTRAEPASETAHNRRRPGRDRPARNGSGCARTGTAGRVPYRDDRWRRGLRRRGVERLLSPRRHQASASRPALKGAAAIWWTEGPQCRAAPAAFPRLPPCSASS